MRILVVEDDPVARRQMQAALDRGDWVVETAADGETAARILLGEDPPQVVVLDWELPDLDGPEVIARLRMAEPRPNVWVMLVTIREDRDDVVAGLDRGADDYLVKPVDAAVLRARVRAGQRWVLRQQRLEQRIAELERRAA